MFVHVLVSVLAIHNVDVILMYVTALVNVLVTLIAHVMTYADVIPMSALVKLLVVVRIIQHVEVFVVIIVLAILTHQKHQQLHVIVILFVIVRRVIVLVIKNIFVICLRL